MTTDLPEIIAAAGDGLHDLAFAIVSHQRLASGASSLRLAARHRGQRVGFELRTGTDWLALRLGTSAALTMHRGTVTWHATGADSDALVSVLDQLFETAANPAAMAPAVEFTAWCLAGDPRDLAAGAVDLKLVHESQAASGRVELYAHIELAAAQLQLGEKDRGYRGAIVRLLGGR